MNALFYLHPEEFAKLIADEVPCDEGIVKTVNNPVTFHREYLCDYIKPKTFALNERVFWVRKCNGERLVCEIKEHPDNEGRVLCKFFFRNSGESYLRRVNVEDLVKP